MDRALMIASALMVAVATAAAQTPAADAPAAQQPDTSKIILSTPAAKLDGVPAADLAPVSHPVSSAVAADISAGMPKYQPAAPQPAAAANADLRDIDKPKNEIPRLPVSLLGKYVVTGKRIPTFRDRDLYTKEGLIDLSFKEHPGLHIGNLFGLNSAIAYQMFLDEERIENKREFEDIALAMAVGDDPVEAKYIMDAEGDAFMRRDDPTGPVGGLRTAVPGDVTSR